MFLTLFFLFRRCYALHCWYCWYCVLSSVLPSKPSSHYLLISSSLLTLILCVHLPLNLIQYSTAKDHSLSTVFNLHSITLTSKHTVVYDCAQEGWFDLTKSFSFRFRMCLHALGCVCSYLFMFVYFCLRRMQPWLSGLPFKMATRNASSCFWIRGRTQWIRIRYV